MKNTIFAAFALVAVLFSSCVKDEAYPYASISKVTNTTPVGPEDVTVTATVSTLVDVAVKLIYAANGGSPATVDMTGSGDTYTGTIPGQPAGTVVTYYVEATTTAGTASSAEASYTVAEKPAEPKTLFINEVNCGTKQFEIYNSTDKSVDIAGYCFTKDDGDPWKVPAGKGNIPAKGFLVYTAKNTDINEGPSFGLSGTKGFKLCMYKSEDTSEANLVDMIDNSKSDDNPAFKEVPDGWSLSRKADGADEWVLVEGGTMGVSNGSEPKIEIKLCFNEVSGSGEDNEKFFELYNAGTSTISLKDFTINKDEELTWTGIEGEEIAPGGFFAIIGGKGTTERGFSSGFSAKKNVIVELFAPDGTKLDTFQRGEKEDTGWGNMNLDNNKGSWSRIPDGTGKWMMTETKTPGAANATEGVEDATVKQ